MFRAAVPVRDYERLRAYVEKVLQNNAEMQDIVAACERQHRKMLRAGKGIVR